jgi:hypothetical protein
MSTLIVRFPEQNFVNNFILTEHAAFLAHLIVHLIILTIFTLKVRNYEATHYVTFSILLYFPFLRSEYSLL